MAQAQTIYEQLAPYAKMTVVPGVTVGRLVYANSQDMFSDSLFPTVAGLIPANTEISFFSAGLGETGQGWTAGMTAGQTNAKLQKGQFNKNQCFVATHFGVGCYYIPLNDKDPAAAQTLTLPSTNDLFALFTNFSWDLNIGRGIVRTIGSLLEYPDVGGVWAEVLANDGAATPLAQRAAQNGMPAECKVKLALPVVFPPLINVAVTAKCGSPFTLSDNIASQNIVFRATFSGFLMTMPV